VRNVVIARVGRRKAQWAKLGAWFRYASALHANACGWPVESHILDQLETEARREWITNEEERLWNESNPTFRSAR
jgi:hypothetical protein